MNSGSRFHKPSKFGRKPKVLTQKDVDKGKIVLKLPESITLDIKNSRDQVFKCGKDSNKSSDFTTNRSFHNLKNLQIKNKKHMNRLSRIESVIKNTTRSSSKSGVKRKQQVNKIRENINIVNTMHLKKVDKRQSFMNAKPGVAMFDFHNDSFSNQSNQESRLFSP